MPIEAKFLRFADILAARGDSAGFTFIPTADELASILRRDPPDLVFCAADHLESHDPSLLSLIPSVGSSVNAHALLEALGVPYVGSPPEVIDLALDKPMLKKLFRTNGIPTPASFTLLRDRGKVRLPAHDKPGIPSLPWIIKPSREGNSRGITDASVVQAAEGLPRAIAALEDGFEELFIEEYLGNEPDFAEFTVAMIGNGQTARLFPARLELLRENSAKVISTSDKDGGLTAIRRTAGPGQAMELSNLARSAFLLAGVRDYSRCDILFARGRYWVIEINGQPMVPDSWFGECARLGGLDESAYLSAIIDAAKLRFGFGNDGRRR